jgi:uncharacterized protein YjaZ
MRINIQNVEDLIFQNKEIWGKMPDLVHLRDQWRISKLTPVLRAMGKKSLLDFLRSVKQKHEEIISEHFNTYVTIDKIERHLVKSIEFSLKEEDVNLDSHEIYTGFSAYRDKEKVYLTFWR